jgi:hypothetical protein
MLLAPAGLLAALLLIVGLFSTGGDLGLEVRSDAFSIMMTNLRNDPSVTILDMTINNRNECSTDATPNMCRSIPNATNPSFLAACSRISRYDPHQLHMLWVYGGVNLFSNIVSTNPLSLKIGESHFWATACPRIVQIQITTDKGTATYSFSEQAN